MGAVLVIAIGLFLSHIVGKKASAKGRNYYVWFILSVLFTPITSFVLLLMFS